MNYLAIAHVHDFDIWERIISKLPKNTSVFVWTSFPGDDSLRAKYPNITINQIPSDMDMNSPAVKNLMVRTLKGQVKEGYLHVVEDTVKIEKDPFEMMQKVENMMYVFGLRTWLNTYLDGCNFVFGRYNPLFSLHMDEPEYAKVFSDTLSFCSNANTLWMTFDLQADEEELSFDERFTVPMYYIIEFLARRRNTKNPGSLNYMNLYPTVDAEIGVLSNDNSKDFKVGKEEFMENEKMFKEMSVNKDPDMEFESVLGDIRFILESRMP